MVFCIDRDKNKELSKILSDILKILIDDDGVESLVMNSYLVHIPYYQMFEPSSLIDGINIKLLIFVNDAYRDKEEILESLKITCLEKLHYNILFSVIGVGALSEDNKSIKMLLNDGEILFDKTKQATRIKNLTFMEQSPNVIEYEPKLQIRGSLCI